MNGENYKKSFNVFETTFYCFLLILISAIASFVALYIFDVTLNKEGSSEVSVVNNGLAFSISNIISGAVVYWFLTKVISRNLSVSVFEYLGLISVDVRSIIPWIFITIIYIFCASYVLEYFDTSINSNFLKDLYYSTNYGWLVILSVVIVVPFFEEIIFRGYIFSGYINSIGAVGTILLTSLGWAVIHFQYSWGPTIYLFLFGIILGLARYKTQSSTTAVIMHGILNMTAAIFLIIE